MSWRTDYGLAEKPRPRCCDCGAEYVRTGPKVRCAPCGIRHRRQYHGDYYRRARSVVATWVRVFAEAIEEARA